MSLNDERDVEADAVRASGERLARLTLADIEELRAAAGAMDVRVQWIGPGVTGGTPMWIVAMHGGDVTDADAFLRARGYEPTGHVHHTAVAVSRSGQVALSLEVTAGAAVLAEMESRRCMVCGREGER